MPDSRRLTVLKRLTTFLSTEVTTANGYQHTLTNKVYRGRLVMDGKNDPVPFVSIVEEAQLDSLQIAPGERVLDNADWRLLLQGWAADDRTNPTDPAYNLMADVQKALTKLVARQYEGTADYLLGRLVHDIKLSTGLVRPPEPTDISACFYLKLNIRFVENLANPYDLS